MLTPKRPLFASSFIPPHRLIATPIHLGVATVIKFDDVPDNTVVDSHYRGVTFASLTTSPARQWSAYARAVAIAKSAPNVISVHDAGAGFPAFDGGDGGIQATFANPQRYVSIDACPVIAPEFVAQVTNKPFIQAFDAQGHVLHTVDYPINYGGANYGSWQPLVVQTSSAVIAKVIFSSYRGTGTHVYGLFDRLVFADRLAVIPLGP